MGPAKLLEVSPDDQAKLEEEPTGRLREVGLGAIARKLLVALNANARDRVAWQA